MPLVTALLNSLQIPQGLAGNSDNDGGGTSDTAKIQAAIDACDPNRGGTVFIPQGKYRIASPGLTMPVQGVHIMGEGVPGVSAGQARGSTRLVVDNGVTGITAYSGSHGTMGYAFSRLHVISADSATTGSGIVIQDTESCIIEDVTCSDFIGGDGLLIDGLTGNSQYSTLRNYSAGDCLVGLHLKGVAPNGIRVDGGYYAGVGATPRTSSIGILIESGDTTRIRGVVIQGYATGYKITASAVGHILDDPRFEFCNRGLHIGAAVRSFMMRGMTMSNNLLANPGSGSIAIQIDSGALDIYLDPLIGGIDGVGTTILNNAGTNVKYPTRTTTAPI